MLSDVCLFIFSLVLFNFDHLSFITHEALSFMFGDQGREGTGCWTSTEFDYLHRKGRRVICWSMNEEMWMKINKSAKLRAKCWNLGLAHWVFQLFQENKKLKGSCGYEGVEEWCKHLVPHCKRKFTMPETLIRDAAQLTYQSRKKIHTTDVTKIGDGFFHVTNDPSLATCFAKTRYQWGVIGDTVCQNVSWMSGKTRYQWWIEK